MSVENGNPGPYLISKPMERQLLNIIELSAYLNFKKATIYDMVYRKRIPYIKIGNLLRFRKDMIDSWVDSKSHIPNDLRICYNSAKVEGGEMLK